MSYPIGLAAGHAHRLQPMRLQSKLQFGGRFFASLGPLLPEKALAFRPRDVQLALLTAPPMPEGDRYVELVAEDYQRQTVALVPASGSGAKTNGFEVSFGSDVASWPLVTHIAIIGDDDLAHFSGRLIQVTEERIEHGRLYFEPHGIKIKGL